MLLKGAKFDYDQIKEEMLSGIEIFIFFLFLTTLNDYPASKISLLIIQKLSSVAQYSCKEIF